VRFEDRAPEVEERQVAPEAPEVKIIDLAPMAADLAAAVDAAGPEDTAAALGQLQAGAVSPEQLLVWIDDLRDPEQQPHDGDPGDHQEGVIPDFLKDTQLAGGGADAPPPVAGAVGKIEGAWRSSMDAMPSSSDDDYFFSAARRRRLDDDPLAPPDPAAIADAAAERDRTRSGG
jgi:hypothetical protein